MEHWAMDTVGVAGAIEANCSEAIRTPFCPPSSDPPTQANGEQQQFRRPPPHGSNSAMTTNAGNEITGIEFSYN